jgi:hypothetical protein
MLHGHVLWTSHHGASQTNQQCAGRQTDHNTSANSHRDSLTPFLAHRERNDISKVILIKTLGEVPIGMYEIRDAWVALQA